MKNIFKFTGRLFGALKNGPQGSADFIYPVIKRNLESVFVKYVVPHIVPAVRSVFKSNMPKLSNLATNWAPETVKSLEDKLTETLREKTKNDIIPYISESVTRTIITSCYGEKEGKTIVL